jgi:hypothetical protein
MAPGPERFAIRQRPERDDEPHPGKAAHSIHDVCATDIVRVEVLSGPAEARGLRAAAPSDFLKDPSNRLPTRLAQRGAPKVLSNFGLLSQGLKEA